MRSVGESSCSTEQLTRDDFWIGLLTVPCKLQVSHLIINQRCTFDLVRRMTKIQFFSATCHACGHRFSMPVLSDFSYGEFIFYGGREQVFGFLSAHYEPAWEDIAARSRRAAFLGDSPAHS